MSKCKFITVLCAIFLTLSPVCLAVDIHSSHILNYSLQQIDSHFAEVNGIQLHYLEKGQGPLVVLLHGWPETSASWMQTIVALSDKYKVIAPDLRGLGLSQRTKNGYDKKTIATDIKGLIEHLGEKHAVIVGHDMGGKAAYVMAHLYPQIVSKLVLVDCLIPGTENADALHGGAWHYGFHMAPDIPEMLTKGREREYICAQIKNFSFNKNAIKEQTINEYTKYYASKGGMTAGFNYYRTLKEDAALAKTFQNQKLPMPVLTISGRHSVADKLPNAIKNEASIFDTVIIENSGHFVPEEAPESFNKALRKFIDDQ